jgi:type IV pilus assembly protein PilY1
MRLNSRSRLAKGLQYALALASFALAVVSTDAATLNLATRPLYAGGNVPPLVMIDMSKDHSLHQKAYNDYTDLDGNGTLDVTSTNNETTYNNNTDYFGYFDYAKCYTYDTTNNRFTPAGDASSITDATTAATKSTHYCNAYTSAWSGNFLNWSSMSRIDEVRKILYGGYRSTDSTDGTTVLERAFLPMDAHAWAKYYGGSDLIKLTPYAPAGDDGKLTSRTTITMSENVITKITLSAVTNVAVGDQLRFTAQSLAGNPSMIGWVSAVDTKNSQISLVVYNDGIDTAGSTKSDSSWKVANLTLGGLTICNVTPKDSSNLNSQANAKAPEIRVVSGNYATWGASEKWQCNWYEEASNTQSGFLPNAGSAAVSGSSNGNRANISGINSSAENPVKATRGLGTGSDVGTYYARVLACVTGKIGQETCTPYSSTSGSGSSSTTISYYKPTGLLQKYGASGQMLFGLMTGTYDKNISGGVLRQNVGNFSQEINTTTGVFNSATKGIVWNINKLRPYGYSYSDGGYVNSDSCNYQQTAIVSDGTGSNAQGKPANEGNCSTWGNPMSEIFVETLRYFAGKTANSAFAQKSNGKDNALGLTTATWVSPLDNGAAYCSPLNTLVFNASVSSYDNDQLNTGTGSFSDMIGSPDISTWTNKTGDGESITGKSWFMGELNGTTSTTDKMCSGKTLNKFSNVLGICPEGPSQKGTFQIAGAAYYAKTNRIRSLTAVPSSDNTSLKVSTYAVQLATTTPKISVNVNGKTVNIVPSYMLKPSGATPSSGTLVDFKVISKTDTSGKFYINWEDSTAGGDYDQDVWGILSYTVSGNTISVTTQTVSASTANGQGFGYAISGTTQDGVHFHSGIYSFSYTDPVPITVTPKTKVDSTGGCVSCLTGDPATTATFTVKGGAANQLDDPLRYAAKWGGFKDLNNNNIPDLAAEWDARMADGSSGSDGLPDNYFFASNPAALNDSLERAFLSILQTSSASSVATNSTSLNTGATIYQARFNGTDWSGQMLAYNVDTSGTVQYPYAWDAGDLINGIGAANRTILTYNAATGAGAAFQWNVLPPAYQTALNSTDNKGSTRLAWLRGDHTNEGTASGKFRVRATSVLGDIINSNPQYVGAPSAGWVDTDYAQFAAARKSRTPMVYVGANDGMLHAFTATGVNAGKERFAYVPAVLASRLPTLSAPGYTHGYFVDGTPNVTDAKVKGNWASVLVGSLGAGGAGIYALDVTDPDTFSEATTNRVLWEFTNSIDADLGYTFGQPQIVKLRGATSDAPRWAAVFGNGYNSTAVNPTNATGQAYLYVVYLDHPSGAGVWKLNTDYLKIPTGAGSTSTPNGLSQVFPADVDAQADGTTDIIYAGDLLGNLWKFDMRFTDPTKWGIGTARTLLFQAKSPDSGTPAQPITAPVEVTRNGIVGYIVLFGTGRYVDTADPSDMMTQSFYGIWDRDVSGQTTVLRTNLVKQTITDEVSTTSDAYRITTTNSVTYSSSGSKGWYMDLIPPTNVKQGERVVYAPILRGARVVFTTLVPSSDMCANGGYSWLMELGAISGARLAVTPFDVNHDGTFDNNDKVSGSSGNNTVVVSGTRSSGGIITTPTVLNGGTGGNGKETKISSTTGGGLYSVAESAGRQLGRISWREIQK